MRLLDHIRECFGEGGMSVVLLKECEASWKGLCRLCLWGGAGSAAGRPWLLSRGAALHMSAHLHMCAHLQTWAVSVEHGLPSVPLHSSNSCILSCSSSDFYSRLCAVTDPWLLPRWDSIPHRVRTDGPLKPAFPQILSSTREFSSYFLTVKIYTPTTSWLSLAIPLMKNQDAKRY